MVHLNKIIANLLAEELENKSTGHYSPIFQKFKSKAEKQKLNNSSDYKENYNIPFSISDLKESLSNCL